MVTKNENVALNRSYGLKDVTRDSNFSTSIKDLILESNRRENVIAKIEKRFNALKKKNNNEDEHELNVLAKVLYKLSRQKDEISTKIIILQYQQQTDSLQKISQTENLNLDQNELINALNEQTDTIFKTFVVVNRKLNRRIKNNKSKGNKNIEKFEYLTEIAVKIACNYSKNNPQMLSQDTCEYKVTGKIKKMFLDHFENDKEKIKANITGIPNKNTVDSHVTNAFVILGYPSYKEAKKRKKPKT